MQPADLHLPPNDLQRGSRLGKYELLLRIGQGGMATVWVAREHGQRPEDTRLVAVKAILKDLAADQEFSKMFLDEGRIIKMIRHPNVVDVYEAGEADGTMFISMEWVEGDSLHAIIAEAGKRRPIPAEMAVRIISDAAGGLHAAHELKDDKGVPMNVVHRDVSPHNILIGIDGAVKLVDFGVAKAMGRLSEVTSAGQLKGKFGYMSPEQAMAKKVDRRSDVFALGIVLFELTTGRRLFRGEHDAETLHMVVSGKIPRPTSIDPKYPPELEKIVVKALQRDPVKRFQTAAAFQAELDAFLKTERIVVPRAGIANLLKKVLGGRIEQRRKAIRATIKALDNPVGVVPTSEAPFTAAGPEPSVTGVSAITSGTGSGISAISLVTPATGSTPSGALSDPRGSVLSPVPPDPSNPNATSGAFGAPSGAFAPPSGAFGAPSGVFSGPSGAYPAYGTSPGTQVVVKRGGTTGLLIGIVGLLVALGAVLFLLYGPQRKTTVVNVQAPAAPAEQNTEPAKEAKPEPTKDDGIAAVPVDSLGTAKVTPRAPVGAPRPHPKGKEPTASPANPPPQAPVAAPPRKNPYE